MIGLHRPINHNHARFPLHAAFLQMERCKKYGEKQFLFTERKTDETYISKTPQEPRIRMTPNSEIPDSKQPDVMYNQRRIGLVRRCVPPDENAANTKGTPPMQRQRGKQREKMDWFL